MGESLLGGKAMISFAKTIGLSAALLAAAQPCLAADAGHGGVGKLEVPLSQIRFDLAQPVVAANASASMTLAASRQAATEMERKERGRGISTGTILVIGGVLLLVVVIAAAVAGATPTPGPREGAFD